MMLRTRLNCLLAGIPILSLYTATVQCLISRSPIEPAETTVYANSVTGVPLFPWETVQLTDDAIQRLSNSDATAKYANLFDFGHLDKRSSRLSRRNSTCKVFPGDEEWPSKDTWDTFNDLLGGALIPTVPAAASCYKNWGLYDAAKCAAVAQNFSNPYFHESDPTSTMWPIFQGRTCMPTDNPNGTCTLGAYPAYAINISNVAQIQLAINFARNTNTRIVIKNTGHDYLGKSSGAGSLSVWTHNLKDITYLPNFENAEYSGKALKIGAGATVREVYQAAHKYEVSALGGICESVGYAGGYVAGGGHTPLSGLYGMAADHVMALEVITADGRFVTASSESNPDLYWALRGGGGSTYGIVTSIIIRVHPKVPVTISSFTFGTSPNVSAEAFFTGLRTYFSLFIPFTDAGTYSFFFVYSTNGSYSLDMNYFFAPNHTISSFNALVKPWFDKLSDLGIPFTPVTKQFDAFYPAYQATWGGDWPTHVGDVNAVTGNRLFPRGNWEDPAKFNATFDTLRRQSEAGRTFFGYHQAPRNRANVDNAVNTAFRHVIAFLLGLAPVPENATPSQIAAASHELTYDVLGKWRDVAPNSEGGGSYGNEADVMEPDWQDAFYGTNYPRLREIKKKWDPEGLFYAVTGVGSEDWEVRDGEMGVQTQNGRLCRV